MNRASLAARLATVEPSRRFDAVLAEVCDIAAGMLDGGTAVEVDRPFHDYGYTSLAAVEFTRRLSAAAGFEIPAVLLFEHPTPTAVAWYLYSHFDSVAAGGGSGDPATPPRRRTEAAATASTDEPIAIIGMACRYPGGVAAPEDLWRLVESGTDAITGFPADRGWDLAGLYHPDADHPGTTYVRSGGFLDRIDAFDPEFFQISPREALAMDPQQRLLLEGAWEAFEHAGIPMSSRTGSKTGTFLGLCGSDYAWVAQSSRAEVEGYWGTGTAGSVASGRLAYTFGFEGPAITVDTACSSSLVALHLAAASLRSGECSLALAGGVTVMTTPNMWLEFTKHRALSPDGRCRSFAADANGTAWSEGMGLVLLERLSDARRHGRRILGVVRGSAVNQDGRSNGLTAPRGGAQEAVIRQALANAGLTGADIDVVEAHGTGTPLGDPIEARALLATYGRQRPSDRPLLLGSLKSNIGHTQAAAGVGGVIKMLLAMRHRMLPRSLYAGEPTPDVDWSSGGMSLLRDAVEWAPGARPRRAAVSAFGVGGTNAHLIVEEPPATPENPAVAAGAVAWVLSAKTPAALSERRRLLAEFLSDGVEFDPLEIAGALAAQDQLLEYRTVVVGTGRGELLAGLSPLVNPSPAEESSGASQTPRGKIAFVFPGQGSQWRGMAVELLDSSPAFAQTFHDCAIALAPHLDRPPSDLEAIVRDGDEAAFEQVDIVQPVLFAVLVSLATLWRSHGVAPDVVVGHSQGEIAAAYIAGGLSLDDAAAVVALRAKAIARLARDGGMISVAESAEAAAARIERHAGVSLAAVNSPASVVISGERSALTAILAECEREGLRAKRIPVDYASHSAHVEPLKSELVRALSDISPRSGQADFCSSVTGNLLDTADLDARYWYRNLRRTVRFESAVSRLIDIGVRTFIEISPHPVLVSAIEETIEHAPTREGRIHVTPTVTKHDGGLTAFLGSVANLYTEGVPVDWRRAYPRKLDLGIDLPTHPFDRDRYWIRPGHLAAPSELGLTSVSHPLLTGSLKLAAEPGCHVWTGTWSLAEYPWIADHRVCGAALVPGTAFVELAAYVTAAVGGNEVEELHLEAPLPLPDSGSVRIQVWVGAPDSSGKRALAIHSAESDAASGPNWQRHATGTIAETEDPLEANPGFAAAWPPAQATPIDLGPMYGELAREGLGYGPVFQNVRKAWSARGDIGELLFAEVELPGELRGSSYAAAHPALLDSAFHVALEHGAVDRNPEEVWIPFSWRNIRALRPSEARSSLRAGICRTGDRQVSLTATDQNGVPVLSVGEVALRPIPTTMLSAAVAAPAEPFHSLRWIPVTRPIEPSAARRWAVLDPTGAFDCAGIDLDRWDGIGSLIEAMDHGAPAPHLVLVRLEGTPERSADAVEAGLRDGLRLVQRWLADDRLSDARLVLLTTGATGSSERVSLTAAALWGLVGSAQSEHPGRFTLVDLDNPASTHLLPAIVELPEPRIRVRGGSVEVARLFAEPRRSTESFQPDAETTILITGGTSGIGAAIARHLVDRGARHLVLVSRRGERAAGAETLAAELRSGGAVVTMAACDVADKNAMSAIIDAIPAAHPLAGLIHSAGVLDDGLIATLTEKQLARVLRPKIAGTLILHELTEHLDLRFFVLMSSLAGVIGAAGQANYAAANSFLDAMARLRRSQGLAATSIAWGLWADASAMTEHLAGGGVARLAGRGLVPMRTPEALGMFDAAVGQPDASIIAASIDTRALLADRASGGSAPMFDTLLPDLGEERSDRVADPLENLADQPDSDWEAALTRFVRAEIAAVLRFGDGPSLPVDRSFQELGLDSLGALQLRNRINASVGLSMPVSVVFDHPTVTRLAQHVTAQLRQRDRANRQGVVAGALADIRRHVRALDVDDRSSALAGLTDLVRELSTGPSSDEPPSSIETASVSELFDMIDNDMGVA
ncbi:acyl transferase domain-containing protein [Nocardia tenerifensis]|uniref:Acyl transferase domain-containing protein n=1 Tax=Nocardia tenerifensis TaxID=228006 RepID=A0A318JSB9_9NOCA|nr:type I polyketide synthase [Nocardia tenerifensis]PXX54880.1 acyl transferase domain-containing protein [Nocardia tenerifensis]